MMQRYTHKPNGQQMYSPGQQQLLKMTTCTRLRFIMISETNSFASLRRFSKISVYATRQQIPISRQRHAKEHYSTPKIFGTCYMECTMEYWAGPSGGLCSEWKVKR